MESLQQLMQMLGGQSTPPAMGGPQPPAGTPFPFGAMGGNERMNAALQGIGAMTALDNMRKFVKAQSTVGMQLDKPTRVDPMAANVGPGDLQARAQRMAAQAPGLAQMQQGGGAPGAPGGLPPMAGAGMPPGGAGGGAPQGGGMPGGLGQLLAMLMQARGGAPGGM